MTEIVSTSEDRCITSTEDVIDLYAPMPKAKIGMEIEHTAYKAANNAPINNQDATAILAEADSRNLLIHLEPSATILERVTRPYPPTDIGLLILQADKKINNLHTLTQSMDISLSPYGNLPHIALDDHELVDKPRFQTFFNPPRADMVEVFRDFANTTNIQASISHKNADHLLKIIRITVALEPLLLLSTDSSCGFFESKPIDYMLSPHLRNARGVNGGIPDFYYTAKTGADFISAHIDFTFTHKHIFAYFNHDEELTRLPSGEWTNFASLESQGLGPQNLTNYLQAQSESWRRACNIAPITAADGSIVSHRAEIATFQTGLMHQRATAALLAYLIAFDEDFYHQTESLLRDFCIDLNDLAATSQTLKPTPRPPAIMAITTTKYCSRGKQSRTSPCPLLILLTRELSAPACHNTPRRSCISCAQAGRIGWSIGRHLIHSIKHWIIYGTSQII